MKEAKTHLLAEARQLKVIRKALKMSQAEFAEAIGKDQTMVSNYELALNAIPGEVAKTLNEKFDISFEFYFKNKGPMRTKDIPGNLLTDIGNLRNHQGISDVRLGKLEEQMKKLITELFEAKKEIKALRAERVSA